MPFWHSFRLSNAISEVRRRVPTLASGDRSDTTREIGRQCLNAGLGFGGGCCPRTSAFMYAAGLGADQALTFLRKWTASACAGAPRWWELATTACGGSLLDANIAGTRRGVQTRIR